MQKKGKRELIAGLALLAAFAVWTVLIRRVDVRAVGPNGTSVGFAALNVWFHRLTGVHMALYTVTDWLELVPIVICLCFGAVGLRQWIQRKRLLRVDADILLLGVYYIVVILGYLIFAMIPINYRPILIDGCLEASYPSSTTLLVLSVMPTLKYQIDRRAEGKACRAVTTAFSAAFSAFMVIGRLVAGVHWATDIVGSVWLSAGLFLLYSSSVNLIGKRREEPDANQ